jgi:hypothetical protein
MMPRNISPRVALALVVAALLAACAGVPDAVVMRAERLQPAVPLGRVLVVVDVRLDRQASQHNRNVDELLRDWYAPLGQALSEAVVAAGGTPTVVYVPFTTDLPEQTEAYSQVWTQRIVRMRTEVQGSVVLRRHRTWMATVEHRTAPAAPLVRAYQVEYASDGIDCIVVKVVANKEQCASAYRALLSRQLGDYLAPS